MTEHPADRSGIGLLFLGTGTSAGVPMIGCDCPVCRSDDPRDNRTRCSVVVTGPGGQVLVDTTPELRVQCVTHGVKCVDAVVYTHAHADHVCGLDDVRRFNAIRGGSIDVWADDATHDTLLRMFPYAFQTQVPNSPLFRPSLVPRVIDGPFEVCGMRWTPVRYPHGVIPALGFRISVGDGLDVAYCTDCSAMPPTARDALRDLDLLVLDALQPQKHPTHLTIDEALEVIDDLRPRRALLTHMSHGVSHAAMSAGLPTHVAFACDGLSTFTRVL